jgi:GNAT superfamily N-acetyltransferase
MNDRVVIRTGRNSDSEILYSLLNSAIAWMVARGQGLQWGATPASEHAGWQARVEQWIENPGLRIAEIDGQAVGASVIVAQHPEYVPPTDLRETYLFFLISDRLHAGRGIGSALVQRAADEARDAGSRLLRVDCWAQAPTLVAWYEQQGFAKTDTFVVEARGHWHGQVLEMLL